MPTDQRWFPAFTMASPVSPFTLWRISWPERGNYSHEALIIPSVICPWFIPEVFWHGFESYDIPNKGFPMPFVQRSSSELFFFNSERTLSMEKLWINEMITYSQCCTVKYLVQWMDFHFIEQVLHSAVNKECTHWFGDFYWDWVMEELGKISFDRSVYCYAWRKHSHIT